LQGINVVVTLLYVSTRKQKRIERQYYSAYIAYRKTNTLTIGEKSHQKYDITLRDYDPLCEVK